MITVELMGGLGNLLFQLCAAKSISKEINKEFFINKLETPKNQHTNKNYYESLFKNFKQYHKNIQNAEIVTHRCMDPYNNLFVETLKNKNLPIQLDGYFQHFQIVDKCYEEFRNLLWFDKERLDSKYPNISSTIFLHIRGGDYLTTDFLIDLRDYYKKAVSLFPGKKFSVFTNDIPYSQKFLKDFDYDIINENEEDSLYLMSKCEGGICANSTFSWWGGYLNKDRKIVIPSKWSQKNVWHDDTYYVPNWIILELQMVSVIIPSYNRFKYLLNAISSVKAQTYKNIEIIVVNDRSDDSNYYSHDFGDITIIHQDKNSKEIFGYACAGYNRNIGINISKGTYLAFLDDDDIWFPKKLEYQIKAMQHSKLKFSCTDGLHGHGIYNPELKYKLFNEEAHYEIIRSFFRQKGSALLENGFPVIWNRNFIEYHNCIITSSVVVTRDMDMYFENVKNGEEDYTCWLKILNYTDCIYVKEPLFYYDANHGSGRNY